MALQYDTTLRNGRADAVTTSVGAGAKLRIYTGTAPGTCGAAFTGTLLSEHTCGTPFAAAASGGAHSPTLPANVNAVATGTAGYWRLYDSTGTTCKVQGTVGTTGADLNLNTLSITSGGPVQVTSWTWTEGGV
jgi:hypothetical protein